MLLFPLESKLWNLIYMLPNCTVKKYVNQRYVLSFSTWIIGPRLASMNKSIEWCRLKETSLPKNPFSCQYFNKASSLKALTSFSICWLHLVWKINIFQQRRISSFWFKVTRCRKRVGSINFQVLKCMDWTFHVASYSLFSCDFNFGLAMAS